jgi:hypothetical protein
MVLAPPDIRVTPQYAHLAPSVVRQTVRTSHQAYDAAALARHAARHAELSEILRRGRASPRGFEPLTYGSGGPRENDDPASLRALGGITWLDAALAAYRCLPVRIGEKARGSAKTFVVGDSQQTELAVRPIENTEEAADTRRLRVVAEVTRRRERDTTIS